MCSSLSIRSIALQQDPSVAGDFYSRVFGWKVEADPCFEAVQLETGSYRGEDTLARLEGLYLPGDVLVYYYTDNLEATLQSIEANGGKILLSKMPFPGIGWIALFADPDDNCRALYASSPGFEYEYT